MTKALLARALRWGTAFLVAGALLAACDLLNTMTGGSDGTERTTTGYTVTFDPDGGTMSKGTYTETETEDGVVYKKDYEKGAVITLPEQGNSTGSGKVKAPSTDVVLEAWKCDLDNESYAPATKYTVVGAVTFKAVWVTPPPKLVIASATGSFSVSRGGTLQLIAQREGIELDPVEGEWWLTWSIKESGKAAGTSINEENGLLTVSANETLPSLTIKLTAENAENGAEETALPQEVEVVALDLRGSVVPNVTVTPILENGGAPRLDVTWGALTDVDSYTVYYGTKNATASAKSVTVAAADGLSLAISEGIATGTTYYVWVRGKNVLYESDWGDPVVVTTHTPGTVTVALSADPKDLTVGLKSGAESFKVSSTKEVVFKVSGDGIDAANDTFAWYLNGAKDGEASTYTVVPADLIGAVAGAVYELSVVVTDAEGNKLFGRYVITLTE